MRLIQLPRVIAIIIAHCFVVSTINISSMEILSHLFKSDQEAIINNKHINATAFVENSTSESLGKSSFLQKRLPVVKAALEKTLNHTIDENKIPTIAIAFSGGGYRAMLYTAAILHRAHKAGLLDAATYISALSGSTWAVAPWISTGMTLEEFKPYIQACATKPFTHVTHAEKILIADAIAVKKAYNQPRTLVDLYGDLLGNRLLAALGDARHMTYLSDQSEKINDGAYPYPMYAAIDGREEIVDNQTCYTFTPDTIGNDTYRIPSWGHGRKFKNGASTNNAPEKSLAYNMGTWGSAFAASIKEIYTELSHESTQQEDPGHHKKILDALKAEVNGKRLLPFYADVPNYMYKMNTNITDTIDKKLLEEKHMEFVDGGLKCNLPIDPVIGADIIIIVDISAGQIGDELKKVINYAQKNKLPFPPIDLTDIDKKTISIFTDEHNKKAPAVIYMPRISDKQLWDKCKNKPEFENYNLSGFSLDYETNHGVAQTQCFQYTKTHSTKLMNQAEFNIHVNEDKIWNTIEWVMKNK